MSDLIKALQILLKYGNPDYPIHCEQDVMIVWGINPSSVSEADLAELYQLGFSVSEE